MWLTRAIFLLRKLGRNGIVLLYALRHPGTPRGVKLGILAMIAYVLSPIDLVPEMLALIGLTDDVAVLLLGIPFLMKKLPANVQQEIVEKVDQLMNRFGLGGSPSQPGD